VELEPRGCQRRPPVVGDRTARRQTVAADRFGLMVVASFELALYGSYAPNVLLELLFGVAVGFVDLFGRFS
jgi:hypothetical protein